VFRTGFDRVSVDKGCTEGAGGKAEGVTEGDDRYGGWSVIRARSRVHEVRDEVRGLISSSAREGAGGG